MNDWLSTSLFLLSHSSSYAYILLVILILFCLVLYLKNQLISQKMFSSSECRCCFSHHKEMQPLQTVISFQLLKKSKTTLSLAFKTVLICFYQQCPHSSSLQNPSPRSSVAATIRDHNVKHLICKIFPSVTLLLKVQSNEEQEILRSQKYGLFLWYWRLSAMLWLIF